VISSGDRENRGEYTGPPQWDLEADIFLRESTVDTCVLHNVRSLKTIDLRDSKIKSVQKKAAQFSQVIGAWPVDTEFYSCFISYSSKDQAFTEYLHARLTDHAVRCWYAPKDLKIGDPFRRRIDDAIHEHDKLLLVLSEESVKSDWVREEVEALVPRFASALDVSTNGREPGAPGSDVAAKPAPKPVMSAIQVLLYYACA